MIEEKKKPLYLSSIPSEWAVVPLERVLSMCQYGISDGLVQEGKYPVLRMNNIESGSISPKDIKYVDIPEDYFRRFQLAKGDILFNRTNSHELVGQTGIFREEGDYTFASYLIRLRANPDYARSEYLNYYLNYDPILKEIRRLATRGVSQSNINASNLKKFLIALPPLEVQNKIECILQHADANMEISNETHIIYEVLKKGLMQNLLTRGIGHTRFKQTKIGEIPESWDVVELREISERFIGGGTPSTKNPEYWDGNIPWMRGASISGRNIEQGERYITQKGLEESSSNLVPMGNVLVATRVCIGNIAVNKIDVAISQDLTGIVVNPNEVNAEFIYWFLKSQERSLKRLNQGTAIKGILRSDLIRFNIALPPLSEQNRIVDVLFNVDEQIQINNQEQSVLSELKKGLMQTLLTGKMRVENVHE